MRIARAAFRFAALFFGCMGCNGSPPSRGDGSPHDTDPPLFDGGEAVVSTQGDQGASERDVEDGGLSESLVADPGPPRYAIVGEVVLLDGSRSTGAVRFQWSFGNGEGWPEPRASATATVAYAGEGRYAATLTVFDGSGNRRAATKVVSVTRPSVFAPMQSATITVIAGTSLIAVVSPDSDEVTIVETTPGAIGIVRRIPTCNHPRTVSVWRDWLVVPCQGADAVDLVRFDGRPERRSVRLPHGARPYGAAADRDAIFVSLAGSGQVQELVAGAGGDLALGRTFDAVPDARGVALLPNDRLAVTRWRSPDDHAEIAVIDTVAGTRELWTLALDPQAASDTEIGGVPSYLNQVVVSPNGVDLAVPSLQANVRQGAFLTGRALTHETAVRGVVSFVDLVRGVERFELRKQFDDRGFAGAAVYSSRGDYLFVAMPGSRAIERFDVLSLAQAGTLLDVGYAPSGVALSADDRYLFVDAYMSREVVVYDVTSFRDLPQPIARLPIPSSEPLEPEVLHGKQLFNDAFDPRITKDGYIACAHCHLDGEGDNRVWDFTDRGEGLRNTIPLVGRGGVAHGPIHWSGNFDEIQDFEHDIRNAFAGTGLMTDPDFHTGTRDQTLGDPKAGVSADLDALAAYVGSLATFPRSPVRTSTGALSAAARRGRAIFESSVAGCAGCHSGERLTDSAFASPELPLLHDVGTLRPSSGLRLGGPLSGIDTPTLHGLFFSAPYLHDGSAATLSEVLVARNAGDLHGRTSGLSARQIEDLVLYLLSLDGRRD